MQMRYSKVSSPRAGWAPRYALACTDTTHRVVARPNKYTRTRAWLIYRPNERQLDGPAFWRGGGGRG